MNSCKNCIWWKQLPDGYSEILSLDIEIKIEVDRGECFNSHANSIRGWFPKDTKYQDEIEKATENHFGLVDGKQVHPTINDFIFWTSEYYSCCFYEKE